MNHVVLVSDGYLPRLGGIELHVHDLGVRLAAAGHQVAVLTATGRGVETVPTVAGELVVHRVAGSDRAALRRVVQGADVVHAHSSVVSPFAWRAAHLAVRTGIPAVVTVHSMLPHGSSLPMALALARASAGGLRWNAVSEAVARPLSKVLGAPVAVLHNGIDPGPWRPAPGPRPATGGFRIVSALRFTARKRPWALLDVLAATRRHVPAGTPLRAVLVGDGPLLPAVRARVQERGLGPWVELAGRTDRPDLARLYATADAYLAPARWESFGLAALEARCAGLPVVAMRGSGVAEFVRDGIEGFLADDDAHAARLLGHLAADPGTAAAIRRHNTTTDPAVTWREVLPETVRAYREAGQRATHSERTGAATRVDTAPT